MEYLETKFKGKNFYDLLLFLNDLNLKGLWNLHSFTLDGGDHIHRVFFQLYHKETSAFVLTATHNRKRKPKRLKFIERDLIDVTDLEDFIVENVYTSSVSGIEDETQIDGFFPHITNLLLK